MTGVNARMAASKQRVSLELLKAALLVGIVAVLQVQIASLGSDRAHADPRTADAVDRGVPLSEIREAVLESIEFSRTELLQAREDLEASMSQLSKHRGQMSRKLDVRDDELQQSVGVKLAAYQTSLENALELLEKNEVRIHSVERRLSRIGGGDSTAMERSILLPIIQLKGNKTVGSGVVIYSRPSPTELTATEAGTREVSAAAPRYTTFAVTAYHVVKEILGDDFPLGILEDVELLDGAPSATGETCSAVVEAYNADRDLALLRLRLDRPFRHVARALPESAVSGLDLFTRVYAVGCPLGNRPLPTFGEISSKSKAVGDQNFWMVTAPTFFGNSGGGIFRASDGKLIGISSMIYTYTYGMNRSMVVPHMGLFVPIDAVYSWLAEEGYGHVLSPTRSASSASSPPRAVGQVGAESPAVDAPQSPPASAAPSGPEAASAPLAETP